MGDAAEEGARGGVVGLGVPRTHIDLAEYERSLHYTSVWYAPVLPRVHRRVREQHLLLVRVNAHLLRKEVAPHELHVRPVLKRWQSTREDTSVCVWG